MNGYKGKILICKRTDASSLNGYVTPNFDSKWLREAIGNGEYVLLAEFDADVEYSDARAQEIEALQKQIEQERAESQRRINLMLGKIQELQAISHD